MSNNSRRTQRSLALLAGVSFAVTLGVSPAAMGQAPPPTAAPAPAAAAPGVPAQPGAPPAAGQPAGVELPAVPGGTLLVPSSEFRYDPTGRRDPFKNLLQLEAKKKNVADLPPIQQFDLDGVKVVGIVIDAVKGAQAMIKAPGGQTFVVRKGTIVGKNDGEVVEITLQGIRIVEKFLDFMNRETRRETFLKSHPAGK